MNGFVALSAPFALAAAPSAAAITVGYEDNGGPVVGGRAEGRALHFALYLRGFMI